MWILFGLIALLVAIALFASIANSAATYNSAQAAVEAARAAQIASAGQTAASINSTILAVGLILVILISVLTIGYLLWRDRRRESQLAEMQQQLLPPGRWAPGPNAQFRRRNDVPALPAGDLSQTLNTLLIMRFLEDRTPPAPVQAPQPAQQQQQPVDFWKWS